MLSIQISIFHLHLFFKYYARVYSFINNLTLGIFSTNVPTEASLNIFQFPAMQLK